MVKVSVIMPIYNTPESFLREAIESILNQSFSDFEFIIINDGSTYLDVASVIRDYPDPRIKYTENKRNLGLIETLNTALVLADGEYIARMDADDISHKNRLKKQVEYLDKNPEVGVLGTWYKKFGKKECDETPPASAFAIKMSLLLGTCPICHPSVMFRKNLDVYYDKKWLHVEDYALWLELINKTKFANLKEHLLYYRWHEDNICKKHTHIQSMNAQMLMTTYQAKYFRIICGEVVTIMKRLERGDKITSIQLSKINRFILAVKEAAEKEMEPNKRSPEIKRLKISPSRNFYKYALKKTQKDLYFKDILFSKDIDEIIELDNWSKIKFLLF